MKSPDEQRLKDPCKKTSLIFGVTDINSYICIETRNDMTEQELVTISTANRQKIEELNAQSNALQDENRRLLKEYGDAHRKFEKGEMVHCIKEKYQVPRKYFVTNYIYTLEKGKDNQIHCVVCYKVETKNHHQPNGGWWIDEEDLVKA